METIFRRRRGNSTLALTARPTTTAVVDLVPVRAGHHEHTPGPTGDDLAAADAINAALRDLPHTRIQVIGRAAEDAVHWLRQSRRDAAVLTRPLLRRVSRGAAAARRRRPSVIVAIEWLEYEQHAVEALRSMRDLLGSEGRLIVILPNLTHASVRLSMLLGQPRFAPGRAAHLCTVTGAEEVLNEAGFLVTAIERQLDSADALKSLAGGLPEPVLDFLTSDPDALTSHFALVAQAEGLSAAALLHRRFRTLADDHRASSRTAERLDDRVAALEVRVQHWTAETDALAGPGVPTTQALTALEARVEKLAAAHSDSAGDARRALASVERLAEQFAAAGGLTTTAARERDAALQALGQRLDARRSDIEALIRRIEAARYRRLIQRVHDVVGRSVPRGAVVAVASRGDDDLLAFENRKGWHFPQTDRGVYAGHYPADSEAAVAQLEQLRARGARYLLVPRTASWWFEHYRAFHEHLVRRYACTLRDEHTCTLFDLRGRTR